MPQLRAAGLEARAPVPGGEALKAQAPVLRGAELEAQAPVAGIAPRKAAEEPTGSTYKQMWLCGCLLYTSPSPRD